MLRCGQGWPLNRKLPVTAKLRDAVSSTGMVISPGGRHSKPSARACRKQIRCVRPRAVLAKSFPGESSERLFKLSDFIFLKR